MKQNSENPFFGTYQTPFGTPPFDQIKTAHYEPAFDEGIRLLDEEIRTIADNPEPPTFENTIVALERSGRLLDKVSSAFFNVLNAEADDEMMEISQRVSPKLSDSSNNIYLNEKLFTRVKSIYGQKEMLHLSTEDGRLLEETFEAFSVRGAALNPEDKEKYRKLSSELSRLSLTFDQNALKDKNRYELLLTKEEELEGLPESIREAAALRAKEKGKAGWLFNLSAPSYVPFMRYSALRELREKMYREYMSVGNKGDGYDNKEIIRKIVNIRLEIARLMGYTNYADYKLKHTMAKTPVRVYKLLVYPEAMMANLNKTGGLIFSQNLLIALVSKGVLREDAYKWVQRNAMARWLEGADFKTNVEMDADIQKYLSKEEIEACFDPKPMLRHVDLIMSRFGL